MNKEDYKKAIDKINAKDELKNKTFEKIIQKHNKKVPYMKYLVACTMVVMVFSISALYLKNKPNEKENKTNTQISKIKNDLPRFENIEELKSVLEKNNKLSRNSYTKGIMQEETMLTDTATNVESLQKEKQDYSTTNVQVENVDEADIIKTDGKYIYYVANNKVYIVDVQNLKVKSEIKIEKDNERFHPREIYIYENKLVILGNSNKYEQNETRKYSEETVADIAIVDSSYMAKAIIYNIENKEEPKETRQVSLDGSYINSRMIGENLYFISSKFARYYTDMKDDEILPITKDTIREEETKKIEATDIAYFRDTKSYSYMIVAGFNINNNNEANIETFFGASSEIYASEKNLYITQTIYNDGFIFKGTKNIIYKFNLFDSQIKLQCKGEVQGYLNNQFSMDEYEGNLRIATTSMDNEKTSNNLFILDENLQQIGKIEDLAKGEKIYSVRFLGKVGYIVTFEQIDPLFIIDLSNPISPVIKGQLKIPGYSSYLHPYDENHIIGIGYNTKSNGYGGVTDANMKMSMFDVSDLENPKEMFNISIGNNYAHSDIISNHKALFYSKEKNLIGFPVTYREEKASQDRNGFIVYKINLEKGFEKYGEITQKIDYKTNIDRAIYIKEKLYTLSETKITIYDLNTFNKINEIELDDR